MDKRDGFWAVLGLALGAAIMYLFSNFTINYECTDQREAITMPDGAVREQTTHQRKFEWLPQVELDFDIFGYDKIQGAQVIDHAE